MRHALPPACTLPAPHLYPWQSEEEWATAKEATARQQAAQAHAAACAHPLPNLLALEQRLAALLDRAMPVRGGAGVAGVGRGWWALRCCRGVGQGGALARQSLWQWAIALLRPGQPAAHPSAGAPACGCTHTPAPTLDMHAHQPRLQADHPNYALVKKRLEVLQVGGPGCSCVQIHSVALCSFLLLEP